MEKAGGGVSTLDYSQYSQLNQADDSIDTDRFSWSNLPKGAEAAYKKANNPGAFTKLQTSFNAAFNSARTAIREACSSAKESIKSSMLGAYNSIPSFSDATTSASSSLKSLAKRFSFGYTRVPTKEPEDTGLSAENLAKLPTEKGIEGDDRMSTTTEDRASITSRNSMTGRPSEDGDVVEISKDSPSVL